MVVDAQTQASATANSGARNGLRTRWRHSASTTMKTHAKSPHEVSQSVHQNSKRGRMSPAVGSNVRITNMHAAAEAAVVTANSMYEMRCITVRLRAPCAG